MNEMVEGHPHPWANGSRVSLSMNCLWNSILIHESYLGICSCPRVWWWRATPVYESDSGGLALSMSSVIWQSDSPLKNRGMKATFLVGEGATLVTSTGLLIWAGDRFNCPIKPKALLKRVEERREKLDFIYPNRLFLKQSRNKLKAQSERKHTMGMEACRDHQCKGTPVSHRAQSDTAHRQTDTVSELATARSLGFVLQGHHFHVDSKGFHSIQLRSTATVFRSCLCFVHV